MKQTEFSESKYTDDDKRLMDAARESNYAYWNALLTLNGILISVFSAIAFFGKANKWFIFILVVSSIISSWLLISNSLSVKNLYQRLGKLRKEFEKLTDADRKAQIQRATHEHDAIERREKYVQRLLFLEALIILLLFFL